MVSRTTLKPCISLCWLFYLCVFLSNIVCIKVFVSTTNWYHSSGLKISIRTKDYKAHKVKTKGISVEGGVIAFSPRCDTKTTYHGDMEDWLNKICSKVEIVRKCLEFLISVDSFL